jgi:hypothetical protein
VYEDGARDAEGFMVDPPTGEFWIVTKRELAGNRLYRSGTPDASRMNTLRLAGTFPFVGTTGAAISPDGLQVLIRRYSNISPATAASYWSRSDVVGVSCRSSEEARPTRRARHGSARRSDTFSSDNRGFLHYD